MGTIFIFIGLVIILLLFNFNKAVNQDVIQIKNEGGLESKYYHLINTLKTEYGVEVVNRTNTSVTLSIRDRGVYLEFHIMKNFNDLDIIWTMKHLTLGTNKLKWEFNNNDNQQYMLNAIALSLDNFDEKLYNALKDSNPFL